LILFHHRYPTSTANTKNTAHPFTTKDYFGDRHYILVHNGHISNAYSLKGQHEKLGISYQSASQSGGLTKFNDSEALLWDLALTLEGKQPAVTAYGGMAFICIRLKQGKLDKLYFGRNTNPLNFYREAGGIMLSSEGEGQAVEPHRLYTWHYGSKRLTTKSLTLPSYAEIDYSYTPPTESYGGRQSRWLRENRWPDSYYDWSAETEPEIEIDWDKLADQQKAKDTALRYLVQAEGNFELAYGELEFDYWQVAEDAESLGEYEEMRVFEDAMKRLESDPEWTTERSLSSLVIPPEQLLLSERK
jgi:hypothetical protein